MCTTITSINSNFKNNSNYSKYLPERQAVESTQTLGGGLCKYFDMLPHAVHFVLSFPTVQDALDTTPIKNDYF